MSTTWVVLNQSRRKLFISLNPISRELLRQSVTQNLDKNKSSTDEERVNSLGVTLVLMYLPGAGQAVKDSPANIKPVIDAFNTSKSAWESAIVQSAKTDFKGIAIFENVPPGDYWITGLQKPAVDSLFGTTRSP